MTKPNEQAFPIPAECYGLTKREWFAGLAMQGLLANAEVMVQVAKAGQTTDKSLVIISGWATGHADALIAELAKETK